MSKFKVGDKVTPIKGNLLADVTNSNGKTFTVKSHFGAEGYDEQGWYDPNENGVVLDTEHNEGRGLWFEETSLNKVG